MYELFGSEMGKLKTAVVFTDALILTWKTLENSLYGE